MTTTTKIHYHVLAGFRGCIIPESIEGPFTELSEARAELKYEVRELRDNGNTLSGSLKAGYFELMRKTSALCDYLEISECAETECFEFDPEKFGTELSELA